MIEHGWFRTHSGMLLPWKVDCDDLTDADLASVAKIIASKFQFGFVVGVPTGGERLASACGRYAEAGFPPLIVDDVLTTGRSMEGARAKLPTATVRTVGVVLFARGPCPDWVWPIFTVNEWAQSRGTGLG